MRASKLFLIVLVALALSACGGSGAVRAQKRAYKAQENVAKERLELVDRYQACLKRADADSLKYEACDSYLRAAEALK